MKIKKCDPEFWSEMLQSKTRSKDVKTQKMQHYILKAVGALLELKNSKNLNTNTLSKNLSTIIHDCRFTSTTQLCEY